MQLSFVKRINTDKNSIFYSLIKHNNQILGFARNSYKAGERLIKKVTLNESFDIIEDNHTTFIGEDPRCFKHNNKLYILDNYHNDMHLIDYEEKKYKKIHIDGKNISFLSHKNTLYFIHYIKPFELYNYNLETLQHKKIEVDDDRSTLNYKYRGGTPGYKLNNNEYYGFGHKTYIHNGIIMHDIFKWIIHFDETRLPTISYIDIEQPKNSKNICDPTSVIQLNDQRYLITAETEHPWTHEQDYITNVYKIIE